MSDKIELTSHERYRRKVLAEIGLDDDDNDDDDDDGDNHCEQNEDILYKNKNNDRFSSKQQNKLLKHKESSAFDVILRHSNNDRVHSSERNIVWHADTTTTKRIMVKISWIIIGIIVIIVILLGNDNDDGSIYESENIVENGGKKKKKEPYSYNGYKDARIPSNDDEYRSQSIEDLLYSNNKHKSPSNVIDEENEIDEDDNNIQQSSKYHEATGVVKIDALWDQLTGYSEMSVPYDSQHELPIFWHVPKSGGTTLQDLLMHCIGLVGANEVGASQSQLTDKLEIITMDDGSRYVNVDMSNLAGIAHAADLGFASSGMADVVITSWLDETASIFDMSRGGDISNSSDQYKGRCFTLLRHPIRRAISLFYYLKNATWEHTFNEVYKNMTIEEYASSDYSEENWMVRFLSNEMSDILTDHHLAVAKQILESKCLIGIMEEFLPSFKRFMTYFDWANNDYHGPVPMKNRGPCVTRVMQHPDNAHSHQTFHEGGRVWNILLERNRYDVALYEYALHLFHNVQNNIGQ